MKLLEVKQILDAGVAAGEQHLGDEVLSACGADLMSDVLAFSKEKALLLTGLVNPQTVRTAEMMDMKAIVFVRGKVPTQEIINLAVEREMVLLTTKLHMYSACGKLYQSGLIPEGE